MTPRGTTVSNKTGKPAVKVQAGKAGAAKRAAAPRRPAGRGKSGLVTPEERNRLIAEAAYYKAEKRAFAQGWELGDWIEAEAEIDAQLGARGVR